MYLWHKLKKKKTQNLSKKQPHRNKISYSVTEVRTTIVAIDNHMVVIQIQTGKNTIEDVLLDGGFGVKSSQNR
jgi:hypothetical protein